MEQEPEAEVAATVGHRIRDLRSAAGLSLSELARRAGLGKGTLSELEAGRRNPTLGTLYALTAPLGVGLAALIDLGDFRSRGAVSGDGVNAVLLDVLGRPGDAAVTEVYRLVIRGGARRLSPAHGPGVREQLTGVTGVAVVGRVGAEERVGPGETVGWISDAQHSFAAVGGQSAVGVLLITHPAASDGAADGLERATRIELA